MTALNYQIFNAVLRTFPRSHLLLILKCVGAQELRPESTRTRALADASAVDDVRIKIKRNK